MNNSQVIIYNTSDGIEINLHLDNGTVWLNQNEIAELFNTTRQNVGKHINNILLEGELIEKKVTKYYLVSKEHGALSNKKQKKNIVYYSLDMILAVGYRVRSERGIQFRNYATTVLKEYLIKGFVLNDEQLKDNSNDRYFKELLERIRDIRSSEKVFYRQVLNLFATSIDYDGDSETAREFFATVQNKLHFAVHHNTASELIYNRVDSEKDFMGLTTFKGDFPTLSEAVIAKNYLTEKELKDLNLLVSGYLDFAERQAEKRIPMTMENWIEHVNSILKATGDSILTNKGKVSKQRMIKKVEKEYKKYNEKHLTQVEQDYLNILKKEVKNIENKGK